MECNAESRADQLVSCTSLFYTAHHLPNSIDVFKNKLITDNLNEYPFAATAVELAVKDLFPRPKIQFAIGSDKLVQDIQRWLEEPIGTGFTTPNFGSLLPSMIGGNQNSSTVSAVTNEIQRVLQLYQGQQIINLQTAQNAAQLSYWNKSEIIQTIQSVNVTVQNTSILASISLLTLANSSVNINLSIDNNGVSVTNG